MRRTLGLLLILLVIFQPLALAADESLPPWRRDLPDGRASAVITVGNADVTVDLAISSAEQQLGLGYRNGLEKDSGMLFLGTTSQMRTFWMKGMRFCIDIIWIENNQITGAAESVCPDSAGTADADRARFNSEVPVTHVLEMPAGWLKANGYGTGTPVDLYDLAP